MPFYPCLIVGRIYFIPRESPVSEYNNKKNDCLTKGDVLNYIEGEGEEGSKVQESQQGYVCQSLFCLCPSCLSKTTPDGSTHLVQTAAHRRKPKAFKLIYVTLLSGPRYLSNFIFHLLP